VPSETDLTDKRVGVYDFPMKAVNKRVTTQTETIKDQFERQLMLQQNWADNAVSATISFPRENVEEMAAMLREYVPKLKSSSFLTKEHGYKQAPLEAITEEEYVKRRDAINHYHPLTHGGEFDTSDCAGGACPIK
jgi:prephenate dehydrogenase